MEPRLYKQSSAHGLFVGRSLSPAKTAEVR